MVSARGQTGAHHAADLIGSGMSRTAAYQQVAQETGVTARTVRQWIKDTGIQLPEVQDEAFADFNEQQRYEVGNRLVHLLLGTVEKLEKDLSWGLSIPANDVKALAVAFGVLTDKRRLEDGLATDRTEQQSVPAREIVEAKILDLHKRKKQRKLQAVD